MIDEKNNKENDTNIYTHSEAANIIDIIEEVLINNNIRVPSPEDDERDNNDLFGVYGSTYYGILEDVENYLIDLLTRYDSYSSNKIIPDVFE